MLHFIAGSRNWVYTLRVQVKKHMKLHIKVSLSIHYIIFDGPGVKSENVTRIVSVYDASTFQCLIQALLVNTRTGYSYPKVQSDGIKYISKRRQLHQMRLIDLNQSTFTFHFSSFVNYDSVGKSHIFEFMGPSNTSLKCYMEVLFL